MDEALGIAAAPVVSHLRWGQTLAYRSQGLPCECPDDRLGSWIPCLCSEMAVDFRAAKALKILTKEWSFLAKTAPLGPKNGQNSVFAVTYQLIGNNFKLLITLCLHATRGAKRRFPQGGVRRFLAGRQALGQGISYIQSAPVGCNSLQMRSIYLCKADDMQIG